MIKDKLYELAFAYKKTKLWNELWDDQIFAVRLGDGRIGYISIMGKGGVNCGLSLYIGEEGLKSYFAMVIARKRKDQVSPLKERELLVQQECLRCSFEDKETLGEGELQEVRDYAKAHGHKFSGRRAYPYFEKYSPNCLPWFLSSKKDQDLLCQALRAAIEVARGLEEEPKELFDIDKVVFDEDHFDILTLRPEDGSFVTEWTELPDVQLEELFPTVEIFNEVLLKKVSNLPKEGVWESELVNSPQPMQDTPIGVPYFPMTVVSVEKESNFTLPTMSVVRYMENPEKLMEEYLSGVIDFGFCPEEIWVRDNRSYSFFEIFCRKCNVKLERKEELDALEDVEYEILDSLDEDKDPAEATGGFLGLLLLMNDKELTALPRDHVATVRRFVEKEDLSDNLKEKLYAALDKAEGKEHVADTNVTECGAKFYVISVSLGTGCYCHIRVPGRYTLEKFSDTILEAFDIENDHAHAFFMDDKLWSRGAAIVMRGVYGGLYETWEFKLKELDLEPGRKFKYLFDFGDEWVFQCKVLRIEWGAFEPPKVIRSKGLAFEHDPF